MSSVVQDCAIRAGHFHLLYDMAAANVGRPRARAAIVDAVLPAADLTALDVNVRDLIRLCGDADGVLRWLAQHGLIHNQLRCDNCDIDMTLQSRSQQRFVDGYVWASPRCRRQKSVTCDSFFAGSKLPLIKLVDCIYWWSRQLKQSDVSVETGISVKSLIDWHNFIRDVCCQYLLDHPVMMGGPGAVVEINESKFMYQKYH